MRKLRLNRGQCFLLVFIPVFGLFLLLGAVFNDILTVNAAPPEEPISQQGTYAGSSSCAQCHENIHSAWVSTRHAHAYSSPIFQRDWEQLSEQSSCLACHTTGYDSKTGTFVEEGVSCEACHGPFQPNHPAQRMAIEPDAALCSTCHNTTTDEWHASGHGQAGIQCQACHNPHSQTPKADTITELCTNCHKGMGDTFTHSTHAESGLECSNCHMYSAPRTEDPIMGLVPTGHTFTVGSEACIGCHQDTVHNRDTIVRLSADAVEVDQPILEDLQHTLTTQEQTISNLEAQCNVRLYTGLIQGAIIGLVTGGTAAWVVSRRIRVVEIEDEEDEQEEDES